MAADHEIHTLVGAYALDAVDDLERVAVERHLAVCEACAAEVAELRATAARLGAAAEQAPPPALRVNVLTEIRRTRQAPPRPSFRERTALRRWAAAAAAGLILATGVTAYVVQDRRIDRQEATATSIRDVLTASDAKVIVQEVQGGGRISVVMAPSRAEAVVITTGLPESGTRTYQLWTIRGGRPSPSDLVPPGENTQLLRGLASVEALGITREPAGGSLVPTLPVLSTVRL
ncbi:anti-sigma factor [Longispora albida]|uniref:anti-sigma factor n=1 Tax=Longispora albida TaxID=203523 RepID=UPI000373245D|nr:anti-sigma factor [Longispora albida]